MGKPSGLPWPLRVRWQRAKEGSPAPTQYMSEKRAWDRLMRLAATHPNWTLGFEDET
jgi:hypothetical protein